MCVFVNGLLYSIYLGEESTPCVWCYDEDGFPSSVNWRVMGAFLPLSLEELYTPSIRARPYIIYTTIILRVCARSFI